MSDVATLIADMVRAGVDPELIGRTAAAFADQPKPRTAGAIRQERYRERNKPSQVTPCDDSDAASPALDKEKSPGPLKEIKPTPLPPVVGGRAQFVEFWDLFPNKVGKRDAEREFLLALQRASFEEIMAGARRYVAKTDDRPWCNPSTFLHQNRWDDQPADAPPRRQSSQGPPQAKGVVGAAQRMMEKSNGSESIFGSSGNGKLISAEPSDEPRRSAEYLQGGISRQFARSGH